MPAFTLASYNIQYGLGQDGAYGLERIADAVASADVICLQECVQGIAALGGADQARQIAERLNRYYVYGAALDVDASSVGEDGRIENKRARFGNAVLSRWPILSTRTLNLPKPRREEAEDVGRCALETLIDVEGLPLRVYSVHLTHNDDEIRRLQIEYLCEQVLLAPEIGTAFDGRPAGGLLGDPARVALPEAALICGDFNLPPDDAGHALMARFFADTWRGGPAPAPTFHDAAVSPDRIDYIWASNDLPLTVESTWIDRDVVGSDHFPIFARLAQA